MKISEDEKMVLLQKKQLSASLAFHKKQIDCIPMSKMKENQN